MSNVRQGGVHEMFLGQILPVTQAPNGTPVSFLETVRAVLGFKLLGDALRDILEPKSTGRG